MPLKLSLKPHEKFVVNGVVLSNGDRRASLVVENKASILREKDIIQQADADTPAKRVYFPIMMMYLSPEDTASYYEEFALRMTEFMSAVTNREALDMRRHLEGRDGGEFLQGADEVPQALRVRADEAFLCPCRRTSERSARLRLRAIRSTGFSAR